MHIAHVHIETFRGIRLADINFDGTTVLLGDNNTGKSTVFEAVELAIGADRLARSQAIDEHDFYGGTYLASDDLTAPRGSLSKWSSRLSTLSTARGSETI